MSEFGSCWTSTSRTLNSTRRKGRSSDTVERSRGRHEQLTTSPKQYTAYWEPEFSKGMHYNIYDELLADVRRARWEYEAASLVKHRELEYYT